MYTIDYLKKKKDEFLSNKVAKNGTDIWDIKYASVTLNNGPESDNVATNNHYALLYHLKKYAGIKIDTFINITLEHGWSLIDDGFYAKEVMHNTPAIITISDFRKQIIETGLGIRSYAIGPYINYVDSFYDERKKMEIKNKWGRVLLVFPAHSTINSYTNYNYDSFLRQIDEQSKKFDTVVISMYYADIMRGIDRIYKEKGYTVVTSGFANDVHFMQKQRSIIELADAVMSNTIVSAEIYSIFLEKPIYIYNQELKEVAQNGNNSIGRFSYSNYTSSKELFDIASDKTFNNINELKKWAVYYGGLQSIYSPDEMRELLTKYEVK